MMHERNQEAPIIAELEDVVLRGSEREGVRLHAPSVQFFAGITALMGPSGAGKTSLLNLLVGFEAADEGEVSRSGTVAWVPSNLGLWPAYTVLEHLEAVGARSAESLLVALGLEGERTARPHALSLGQQTRLAVARALASPCDCLVMDEPLAHVDPPRRVDYWRVIRQHLEGRSLIFSSHEPETVLAQADAVCFLQDGKVIYKGALEELYHQPASEALARVLGRVNWFSGKARAIWLGECDESASTSGPVCVRPEALEIAPRQGNAAGSFVLESYRELGQIAESTLRHESSGQSREFVHRPNRALALRSRGTASEALRVGLQWLGLFILCGVLMGCGGSNELPVLKPVSVKAWRLPIDGPKLPAPRSVATGPNDSVVALDDAGRVIVFNREGKVERRWAMPDVSVGRPEGVVVLADGEIVVCDTHYHRVIVFDATGKILRTFGESGRADGQFIYPVAIAKDREENLYVGEYGSNDRIQKFSKEGQHLLTFGGFGTGAGLFQRPSGIAWYEGMVYVADAVNNRIQVFQDDGTFIKVVPVREEERTLSLHLPYDLTVDAEGNLLIVEYGAGRIVHCTREGVLLGVFGSQGSGSGQFHTPWGLTVDSRGHLRIADTGNRRLIALAID